MFITHCCHKNEALCESQPNRDHKMDQFGIHDLILMISSKQPRGQSDEINTGGEVPTLSLLTSTGQSIQSWKNTHYTWGYPFRLLCVQCDTNSHECKLENNSADRIQLFIYGKIINAVVKVFKSSSVYKHYTTPNHNSWMFKFSFFLLFIFCVGPTTTTIINT